MIKNDPVLFSDISKILHATTLGDSKAYISQGTATQCCLPSKYHRHACYEIAWVRGNNLRYFVDFAEYDVPDGSLVFLSPGQVHTWQNINKTTNLTVIGFTPDLFSSDRVDTQKILIDLPFFVENTSSIYTVPTTLRPFFEQHFKSATERVTQQPEETEALLRAYLNLILVEARSALSLSPASAMSSMPATNWLTRHFRLSVERHYLERKKVQDYANQLGITTNHLVKTVRQITGSTPKHIIHERMLLEAKRLLAYSSLSVAEIGSELSFSTPTEFGRWFKSTAGNSPGQFREYQL